jgi:hypothetical protein
LPTSFMQLHVRALRRLFGERLAKLEYARVSSTD